jgi:hypothetical protein
MSGRRRIHALALALLLGCSSEVELELLEREGDAAADGGVSDTDEDAGASAHDAHRPIERDASADASDGERTDAGRSTGQGSLVLRYDFAGRGQEVLDRVGSRHGRVIGTSQLDGSGKLVLNGTDSYVDLPARLISRLENATIMVWFEYRANDPNTCWHRLFDFGSNTIRDGRMQSVTSMFYTPRACWDQRDPRFQSSAFIVEFTGRGGATWVGEVVKPFTTRMVAITFASNGSSVLVRMNFDGVERVSGNPEFRLAEIDDVNNWLGRSQWAQDKLAPMAYDEFRIYDRALSPQEIEGSFRAGPDAL